MISRPAIEPAISTLPVMNQLIAKVSSVPSVRQLMALRTDLPCVSAPRNRTTRSTSRSADDTTYHAAIGCLPTLISPMDMGLQICASCFHENIANQLILLDNRDLRCMRRCKLRPTQPRKKD